VIFYSESILCSFIPFLVREWMGICFRFEAAFHFFRRADLELLGVAGKCILWHMNWLSTGQGSPVGQGI
jgi:hypothetical protein